MTLYLVHDLYDDRFRLFQNYRVALETIWKSLCIKDAMVECQEQYVDSNKNVVIEFPKKFVSIRTLCIDTILAMSPEQVNNFALEYFTIQPIAVE